MAKVTRIKAQDSLQSAPEAPVGAKKPEVVKDSGTGKKSLKKAQKAPKGKKPFILIRPIVYFFRYIRDSWREIRQVRWPSRKATWKLFLAIVVYTLLFVAIIMALDAIFTWLFETVIG